MLLPSARRNHALLIAFLVIWFLAMGLITGWNEFCDGMENFAVATSREILRDHHWLAPTLGGRVRSEKPPLTHWSTALGLQYLPLKTETAARLPTVALGLLGGLFMYGAGTLLGRKLSVADGEHPDRGWTVGLSAAVCLLTSPFFMKYAWRASYDAQLTVWLAGYWCFLTMAATTKHRWLGSVGAAVTLAGALMSKGPPALVFAAVPLACIAYWAYRDRDAMGAAPLATQDWKVRAVIAVALVALLCLPWVIYIDQKTGGVLTGKLTNQVTLGDEQHIERLRRQYSFLLVPLPMMGPWIVGVLAALILTLSPGTPSRDEYRERATQLANRWLTACVLGCAIPGLVMIAFAPLRERYLLPTAVPAALAAAAGLRWLIRIADRDGVACGLLGLAALLGPVLALAAAISGLQTYTIAMDARPSLWLIGVMALVAVSLGAWIVVAVRCGKWQMSLAGSAAALLLGQLFYTWHQQYADKGRSTIRPQIAQLLAEGSEYQWAQWVTTELRPTLPDELNIYADRTVQPVNTALLAQAHPKYLLAVDESKSPPPPGAVGTGKYLVSPNGKQSWQWYRVAASDVQVLPATPASSPAAP
jgi:4-amino-4-deoxy-L-arabinose transferase-like glycosyltransferase